MPVVVTEVLPGGVVWPQAGSGSEGGLVRPRAPRRLGTRGDSAGAIDTEGATDERVIAAATGMAVIGNDQAIQPTLHLEDEPFSDGAHFWSDQGWKKPPGRPGQKTGG